MDFSAVYSGPYNRVVFRSKAIKSTPQGLREPESPVWKVLKAVFLVQNVMAISAVILLLVGCIYFAAIASGKVSFDMSSVPHHEWITSRSKVELILIPVTVLIMILIIVGFIGILRPHLKSLKVCQAFAFIGLLVSIVLALSGVFIFLMGILIEILRIFLICFLIIELEKANQNVDVQL